VAVEERELLLAMRRIIGVVYLQNKGSRGLGGASEAVIHQGARKTIEVFTVSLVFQAGERGRTGSVLLGV